jgi:secreted PhoX family phosphatase
MDEYNLKSLEDITPEVVEFVRGLLIGVAAAEKTISYSQLGWRVGIDVKSGDYPRMILSHLLSRVGRFEHEHYRPVITAVVVYLGEEDVGKGFYTLLDEIYKKKVDRDTAHAMMLKNCYEAWKGTLQ